MKFDVAIIGGGIVGAATFYKLQKRNPNLVIALFEKEEALAEHQTGHNSGVIHSGLYYTPGSLKAKNCIEGRHELVAFAKEYGIDHDVCGKVVVATTQKAARNGLVVKKKKKTIRAKKPKVACPYCGELKKTRSNGSSKGSWLRECMNTECDARFYRVDPITHKASVLENGHRGPVKHVIKVMKD